MNYKKAFYFISILTVLLVNVDCKKDPAVKENLIALTFDDGPDAIYTPKVLDILKSNNIKASFFIIGKKIKKFPEVAKRIYSEGHAIGNHTYNHLNCLYINIDQLKYEVSRTETLIDSLFGKSNKYVRMPFGFISNEQYLTLTELGYKIIGWDVDSYDWDIDHNTIEGIVNRVVSQSKPGKIVLLHCADYLDLSSREKTIEALPEIIKELQKKNYKFVTLENLEK